MVRLLTREPCVWRATAATAGPKHMEEMMTPASPHPAKDTIYSLPVGKQQQ